MPKELESKLIKEYMKKGYSYKNAKVIAIKIMVKKGLWEK